MRLNRFILKATALLVPLHAYIGLRLLPDLPIAIPGLVLGILALCLSCVLMPMAMMAPLIRRQPLADRMAWAGYLTMGLFSSLLVLTVLRDVGLALSTFVLSPHAALKAGTGSAMAVPALAALVSLTGFVNARYRTQVVEVDVPLAGLPPQLHGFTIVQISDIHVGPTIKGGYVQMIVDRVNSLSPDLVAVTGDVVDGSVRDLAPHTAPLAGLKARHGSFFVTGNHEYYSGAPAWVAEFRRLGLQVLMNSHVALDHDGARLVVAGVTDYSAHYFDPAQRSDPVAALAGAPGGMPRILLAHQPRSATGAAAAGFDLQLSGHTHGGQFWPWIHFVRLQQPYTAGLHRHDGMWVYTSRGTGYWGPPKRFGAPSEITRLRLVRA